MFRLGQPWSDQSSFNTDQSGDLGTWTADTALPGNIYNHTAVVTKNRIYLLVTNNGVVFSAPIVDGVIGTWITDTAMPTAVDTCMVFKTATRIYVCGGYTTATVATVYYSEIQSDGTLGAWQTGTSLPAARRDAAVVCTGKRVYLIGGRSPTSTVVATSISAPINEDGTIGTWVDGTSLPSASNGNSAVMTSPTSVYFIAAGNSTTCYTAPVDVDGVIGSWTAGTSLPVAAFIGRAVVTTDTLYYIGGYVGSSAGTQIYIATIGEGGVISSWSESTSVIPVGTAIFATAITSSRLYIFGGYTGGGFPSAQVAYTDFIGGSDDYFSEVAIPGIDAVGDLTIPLVSFAGNAFATIGNINTYQPLISGFAEVPILGFGSIKATFSVNGYGPNSGYLSIPVPSISGVAANDIIATGNVKIKKPRISGIGYFTITSKGVLKIPVPKILGTGIKEETGIGSIKIPVVKISGVMVGEIGTILSYGSMVVKVPVINSVAEHPITSIVALGNMNSRPIKINGYGDVDIIASGNISIIPTLSGRCAIELGSEIIRYNSNRCN